MRYELDEWQLTRTAEATGSDLAPRWPELAPGERERTGTRQERYEVHLVGPGGKRFTREVPEPLLARYASGTRCLAKVDSFGAIRSLEPR